MEEENGGSLDGSSPEVQPGGDAEWGGDGTGEELEAGSSTAQPDAGASWMEMKTGKTSMPETRN